MGLITNILGTLSDVFSIGRANNKVSMTADANGLTLDKKTIVPELKVGSLGGVLKADLGEVSTATAVDLPFTPIGNLTSTNVGSVIKEVYDELGSMRIDFSHSDFSSGHLNIAPSYIGYLIQKVVIEVESPFDTGNLTIGDLLVNDILVRSEDLDLTTAYTYEVPINYEYGYNSTVRIYFSGLPTSGNGRVIVYLS